MKQSTLGILICIMFIFSDSSTEVIGAELLECGDDSCEALTKDLMRFARHGSPRAQLILAISYKTGELQGIIDDDKAWSWMRKAKKQKYPPVLYYMSNWYRQGYNTKVNIKLADKHLLSAVKKKYAPALVDLGIMKFRKSNKEEGIQLIEQAAEMGNLDARKLMAVISPQPNSEIKAPVSNVEQNQQTNRATPINPNDEVITIIGDKLDPIYLFEITLENIRKENIYNRRGTTGSRLSTSKCGQPGSRCKVNNKDSWLIMN